MEENEYTTIRLTTKTKEMFEEARKEVAYEQAATADDFLQYLIEFHQKNNK